ncbi:MAG: hypothetical protein U0270_19340 [Labilithrix sp.]
MTGMRIVTVSVLVIVALGACADYGEESAAAPVAPVEAGTPSDSSTPDAGLAADAGIQPEGDAAPGACDPFAPWPKPVRVAGLESETTSSFVLSPDETRAYFARAADDERVKLWTATRANRWDAFSAAKVIDGVNDPSVDNSGLTLSPDGTLMLFQRTNGFLPIGLFVAKRAAVDAPFATPVSLAEEDFDGQTDGSLDILTTGAAVYFVRSQENASALYRRPLIGATFGPLEKVGIGKAPAAFGSLVVSSDELTIYFGASGDPSDPIGGLDIWRASRPGTASAFGDAERVAELDTPTLDVPTWLSPDGCRLYLASMREGPETIYVSEKLPR